MSARCSERERCKRKVSGGSRGQLRATDVQVGSGAVLAVVEESDHSVGVHPFVKKCSNGQRASSARADGSSAEMRRGCCPNNSGKGYSRLSGVELVVLEVGDDPGSETEVSE